LHDGHWSRAKVLQEQPPKLARSDSQALGQCFEGRIREPVFVDEPQRARDRG